MVISDPSGHVQFTNASTRTGLNTRQRETRGPHTRTTVTFILTWSVSPDKVAGHIEGILQVSRRERQPTDGIGTKNEKHVTNNKMHVILT